MLELLATCWSGPACSLLRFLESCTASFNACAGWRPRQLRACADWEQAASSGSPPKLGALQRDGRRSVHTSGMICWPATTATSEATGGRGDRCPSRAGLGVSRAPSIQQPSELSHFCSAGGCQPARTSTHVLMQTRQAVTTI